MVHPNVKQIVLTIQQLRPFELGGDIVYHMTQTKKILVCILFELGFSYREIHDATGVTRHTVYNYQETVDRFEMRRIKRELSGYLDLRNET